MLDTHALTTPEPAARLLTPIEWQARVDEWLPSEADRAYVQSLMVQVTEPGRFADWIAPPAKGIRLSCMALTAPQLAAVVMVANKLDPSTPKRSSLPSILP